MPLALPLAESGTATWVLVAVLAALSSTASGLLLGASCCACRHSWRAWRKRSAYPGIILAASARPCCLHSAANVDFSERFSLPAAHGLCVAQSWMTRSPSSPSRKPTSASVSTKAPSSPSQSMASSMSSSVIPDRSPSLRLAAAHRNKQTSFHAAPAPRRRMSFLVLGWPGNPAAIRASVAICLASFIKSVNRSQILCVARWAFGK